MFKIKVIDRYVFFRFVEVFFATFFITGFILLMQFLWNNIDKIIGKGLPWTVLAEFFLYASLSIVPLALPLAILLASLMAFGNLGEKVELTAMKAAGISLFRIMSSLMIFIFFVCIGAFWFSNNVLPVTQKKMGALISSLRNTSPELGIPVGEFYQGIRGYTIYARGRGGADGKLLKDVMIYDFSAGFDNASVTVVDSARLRMADDKTYLLLSLFNGESFENLKRTDTQNAGQSVPYRRESFKTKDIIIDFDANFNRVDENEMNNRYTSKNFVQLTSSIDSINHRVDSIRSGYAQRFVNQHFFGRESYWAGQGAATQPADSLLLLKQDSLFYALTDSVRQKAIKSAVEKAQNTQSELESNRDYHGTEEYMGIRHEIERHRKLTLPFACLVFFFIGAPLGAIIRKGGLGFPAVVSMLLFIIYYIIDNSGFKLAREAVWLSWQGMWLSSACLLPIGIYLTWRAANDAPIINMDIFKKIINWFKKKN